MTTRTLSELAELCGASLEGDGARVVVGPARLADAAPDEISFLANPRYRGLLETTRAAAVVLGEEVASERGDLAVLRVADPNAAFSRIVRAFAEVEPRPAPGVHPSAVVAPTARLGAGVSVGPHCVVGPGVELGERVVLVAAVTLGAGAKVGADSVLHPGATLYPRIVVGARCTVHAGAVLGADGFGFEPGPDGWVKIPQCGTVVVEDDVEIGANTTIDRARFGATRIRRGAKLDNLVHVAHNVEVGEGALLVAQVGVAGSATVGPRAILGGQVGVAGHVTVGDGARVAGQAGVFGDIEEGGEYLGFPARPRRQSLRTLALSQRLPQLFERVRELERRLAERADARPEAGEP